MHSSKLMTKYMALRTEYLSLVSCYSQLCSDTDGSSGQTHTFDISNHKAELDNLFYNVAAYTVATVLSQLL